MKNKKPSPPSRVCCQASPPPLSVTAYMNHTHGSIHLSVKPMTSSLSPPPSQKQKRVSGCAYIFACGRVNHMDELTIWTS